MSKSYRIRTTPGVDKNLNVLIDQDFEYLEILSLKLLQSEIYTRQCSDYGVVVGRVSVNNGFGLPNAKVSIFIPLESEDENNPIISELYPYKTLNDVNEDGYRYNLLPYRQSHSGHQPTGTFFDREDVLTDPTLIEVFDKYYKYTATTNESGDFMLFGVPVGSHQLVMDVDLSDIGEFSLSPQDLVRMGVATENQVSGTNFKTDENLRILPQLVNIVKTIQVEPLWGQEDLCNIGINRSDFDLTSESNIDIRPTSVFMGSIISSPNTANVKRNCKPKGKMGYLCNLTTNSGEILAIRQTINQDENGRPILETVDLEQGGLVIDENGTWLIDVPMNLDYVTTNEFGDRVLSNDPEVGIPTAGKYRFKVKWGQSPTLTESVKRGYFLVPNVKEYGWDSGGGTNPITSGGPNLDDALNSYAFSLDWEDYGDSATLTGQRMIQESINCEDRFYPMFYNKVYTVSQFIDESRKGSGLERYVGIKNMLDSECESTNNRFPTNDGNLRFDILYIIFTFISIILTPIFFAIIILLHLFYFLIELLRIALLPFLIGYVALLSAQSFAGAFSAGFGATFSAGVFAMGFVYLALAILLGVVLRQLWKMELKGISVPLLTYPDCSLCDCKQGHIPSGSDEAEEAADEASESEIDERVICPTILSDPLPYNGGSLIPSIVKLSNSGSFKYLLPLDDGSVTGIPNGSSNQPTKLGFLKQLTGYEYDYSDGNAESVGAPRPYKIQFSDGNNNEVRYTHTLSLPIADRINLFNTKAKYFNDGVNNPGGGVNRMKVKFNPISEPAKSHFDNTIVLICDKNTLNRLNSGQMVTFNNPSFSEDVNLTDGVINIYGNNAITGETKTGIVSNVNPTTGLLETYNIPNVQVNYSNPNGGGNLTTTYTNIKQYVDSTSVVNFHKFPTDIEYFQVITGMTYSEFSSNCVNTLPNSLNKRFIENYSKLYYTEEGSFFNFYEGYRWDVSGSNLGGNINVPVIENIKDHEDMNIVIMSRGVDPYSLPTDIEYGLGRLFGYSNEDSKIVNGRFRLNIPINGGFKNTSHDKSNYSGNSNVETDSYTGSKLYHDSFLYQPDTVNYSGFTSNLLSYYSKLDLTQSGYKPICGDPTPPTVGQYTNNGTNGIMISSNNLFTKERTSSNPYTSGSMISNGVSNGRNRGYFPNEVVEGSTAMGITFNYGDLMDTRSFYYAPIYNTTGNTFNFTLGSSNNQIVMRGDRLPTSTTVDEYCCNAAPLQKNSNLSMYVIPNIGVLSFGDGTASTGSAGADSLFDFNEDTQNIGVVNSVIDSFSCGNSAPLDCYDGDSGSMIIYPSGNNCYKHKGKVIFKNGCYIFVTKIFGSLGKDLGNMAEWISRNMISLGACRNVFSHRFNNNWVNGTLFAFPFSNDVIYTSPTSSNPNQPISRYCLNNVLLHPTNNFYYRSSPFYYDETNPDNSKFVGNEGIKYPTTMMDLGPVNAFIQEIVMSDDYDGYVVNKLDTSSYGDVEDLLNLFIISRLINQGFLRNVLGSLNILGYFSRFRRTFDGDYSQLISINSELGVAPFQATNYPDNPPGYQNPIYFNDANNRYTVIGVFFSSNTQTRDYISPKRQILNPFTSSIDGCSFNDINVFSQEVPMYQWEIENETKAGITIFGWQENNWKKEQLGTTDHPGVFSYKYQDLDRLKKESRYFRTNGGSNQTFNDKGYIYSVNGDTPGLDIDESVSNWDLNLAGNQSSEQWITTGAPFHFYFGLRRGGSAFDRFRQKWINTEIIID